MFPVKMSLQVHTFETLHCTKQKAMIGLKTNTPKPKKQKQNEKTLVIGEISEI